MKKNLLLWAVVCVTIYTLYTYFMGGKMIGTNQVQFSEFMKMVDNGQIDYAELAYETANGKTKDGKKFTANITPFYSEKIIDKLIEKNVAFNLIPSAGGNKLVNFLSGLLSWLPMIVFILIWVYLLRQVNGKGGGTGPLSFGKSKAKMIQAKDIKFRFKDVAGIDEAKQDLQEIVDFLRDSSKYQKVGGRIPKGCLLFGQPGTGKTLLAKAIAGEAQVPFFSISGSDFVEMFVGVGASRVREMFANCKRHAPCIVFIDEIDAVGRHRGIGLGGGNDEREQTLNQLLVEMDGFDENLGVVVIAATNRPDVLDPALLRPGRFDRQIAVPLPDIVGREQILEVHAKKVKIAPSVDINVIARGTPGFSGADLENLINEAALLAARHNKNVVTMVEMEEAKDKILMGSERKSMVMQEDEKRRTAYHEGGHAIVGINMQASDPIHKATIIPRGRALGLVMRLPKHDRVSLTRAQMKADLAVAMGGRVAEEIIFGYEEVTSGAASDISHVTKLARSMVLEWGMSDKVGAINYSGEKRDKYLGGGGGNYDYPISEETARTIDSEIRVLVDEAHEKAKSILLEKLDNLHTIAKALLEYETLTGDEILELVAGNSIVRSQDSKKSRKSSIPHTITTETA